MLRSLSIVAGATLATAIVLHSSGALAVEVETSNFISSPTNFNGFEGIGSSPNIYTSGPPYNYTFYPINTPYTEGGITVQEVSSGNGDGYGRVPVWNTGSFGMQGNQDWAPQDQGGYTEITLASGADFQSIQFLASSNLSGPTYLDFVLLENGNIVDTGSVVNNGYCCGVSTYLGFSGGGFDELELQDQLSYLPTTFDPNLTNLLVIDSISAVSVAPLPSTWIMMLSGLLGLGFVAHRKQRPSPAALH